MWETLGLIAAGVTILWFLSVLFDGDGNWLLAIIVGGAIGSAITEWIIKPDKFFPTVLWISAAVLVVLLLSMIVLLRFILTPDPDS
ncbi:MAG: hypothetical protein M3N59_02815 [bacterium]|nr:hypothetical protein [bacterium]